MCWLMLQNYVNLNVYRTRIFTSIYQLESVYNVYRTKRNKLTFSYKQDTALFDMWLPYQLLI